ncbi:MAG TPA: ABC transporter ATP-binding protein [Methanolinea sp.]|jgi:branched-chain amino acid transport system ATP-binding protein|nr:ABC transporter ATP-binding protein [Methanolinea sp.]HPC55209.1 ABC transporter ATP-binding protein [Methanolinea sp.]HQE85244.1 ABC transporter ATP-binding protein [Methanolinea sp.]HQI14211.1 ABC transporter ATP-binding protein [Methanolinea sp.]HQJ18348.1 ABC transporter ATP-binding protein [Methanolinea sp.]
MLHIEDLNVSYSYLQVLWDVSLHVDRGEVVTLIGSNGAGKTTLVSALFGLVPAIGGRIEFEGENISGMAPFEIVRRGLSLVPEKRELFPRMTVRENLELGAFATGRKGDPDRVFELFPHLAERQDQDAGTLSGGEQQMLAIARCLMANPRMIVLDEPSLGLSPKLVHTVLEAVERLNSEGITILLVEQNVRRALEISHRAYVIEAGRITRSGRSSELLHDEQIREAYLGL